MMRIIAGLFRHRPLAAPKGSATRPTSGIVREALFNICQTFIDEADVLDLFAGSGAMGLEALSRGASSAAFVENDRHALSAIKSNIATLKVQTQTTVVGGDVFKGLQQLQRQGRHFLIIYADPPYDAVMDRDRLLTTLDESDLLLPEGHLFIEESTKAPEPTVSLRRLTLKSCRQYGRSQLRHYLLQEPSDS